MKHWILCLALATTALTASLSARAAEIEAAGCLITTPHGFVMGINRLINRLQLPIGGRLSGETAEQTAERETREETGLEVTVGETALKLKSGSVVFYHCTPLDPEPDYSRLKPTDRMEVSRALVVNPDTLLSSTGEAVETRWRFPQMRWILRALFLGLRQGASAT